jgi:hypothetical protein
VFDVDGEGLMPRSQIKHLICSEDSGINEGLTYLITYQINKKMKRVLRWKGNHHERVSFQFKSFLNPFLTGEGLSVESFEMLMEHIKANEDGMVRIADLVHLLEQK